MGYPFTKAEIAAVSWGQHRSVTCPYCGAAPRTHCHVVKMKPDRQKWGNLMSGFHKARTLAFLMTRVLIIKEEVEYADLVA
jgi:hypothetical protein